MMELHAIPYDQRTSDIMVVQLLMVDLLLVFSIFYSLLYAHFLIMVLLIIL